MKTTSLLQVSALALAFTASLAFAQDIVTPTPAPAVVDNASAVPAPDHVVYLAKLPAAADLMKSASAQGTSVTRIDQTSDSVMVSYQYANGRKSTFAYRLLSSANDGSEPIGLVSSASTAPRVVYASPAPAATVVYSDPGTVYYTDRYYRSYDPAWDFWTPLALGVGLGWASHGWGWHGHGGYGGWHGGHGGWHH
jgi:hypothetical protein